MASDVQKVGPIGSKTENTLSFDDMDHLVRVVKSVSGNVRQVRISHVVVWYSEYIRGIQVHYAANTRTESSDRHMKQKSHKDIEMEAMHLESGSLIHYPPPHFQSDNNLFVWRKSPRGYQGRVVGDL